jgi:hypothetical protein
MPARQQTARWPLREQEATGMNPVTELIDRYIAMWSEADGRRLQAIIGFFDQVPAAASRQQ